MKLVKEKLNCKGFTLIELLVVIVIIGILAAIVFPQYEKSMERNKSTEALKNLKAVKDLQSLCLVEKGEDSTLCGDGQGEAHNLFDYTGIIQGNTAQQCDGSACGPSTDNFDYYMDGQMIYAKRNSSQPKYLLMTTSREGLENRMQCINQSGVKNYCQIIGFTQQEGGSWFQPQP